MKRSCVKIVALILVSIMMVGMLTACAKKVSGSYEAEISVLGQKYSVTYKFSGSNVTVTSKLTLLGNVNTTETKGTYKITENSDGSMEITFNFEKETDTAKSQTVTFEEGDGYIKLAGIQYDKV